MKRVAIIISIAVILCCSCHTNTHKNEVRTEATQDFSYNIQSPDKTFILPDKLMEISGIAAVTDNIIACIADEKGIVYFYNLSNNAIENKIRFADEGDFEDLSIINDTIYVLDSKGIIWVIKNFKEQPVISSFQLAIQLPFELEGLCRRQDTLFIAAKYYHNKKRDEVGNLPIWEVPISSMQVSKIIFEVPDMVKPDNSHEQIPFHTSALLYNETNAEWLFISSHSKALMRSNYKTAVIQIQKLPEEKFTQPEGICITPSGNLLISNEGKDNSATILLFTNKNKKP
jgi:hypothetical protein